MKNNLFDRFKPKENKFFPLLSEMADIIEQTSVFIIDCVQAENCEEIHTIYRKIKNLERKGDKIEDKIFDELNQTFITPFDREDIDHLAGALDDVTDNITSCAKRIMLYNPKHIPSNAVTLAKLVNEAAMYITKAIAELNTLKKSPATISEYSKQLKNIENKADDVYERFLIQLFENEKDAIEVIKLKDILHELEMATDSAERVGKIIKTMVVKYS